MKITELYIVKKGLTNTNYNLINELLSKVKPSDTISLDSLCQGDELFIDPNDEVVSKYIPNKEYKNKVKNPKKTPIDLLVVFSQNNTTTKPVRFKQPDPNKIEENDSKDLRIKIKVPRIEWVYEPKNNEQIIGWFRETDREGLSGFENEDDFLEWYRNVIQDKSCEYCGLTERECQEIVHNGHLTSLRFPIYKNTSRGVNRGYWLEIDRRNPIGLYSRENCNPSCYFCNNDKSDVFNDNQYKLFIKDRIGFMKNLLKK